MKLRRILAIVMAAMMLLGMMPTAMAFSDYCHNMGMEHNWGEYNYPIGSHSCDDIYRYCVNCSYQEYVEHKPGRWYPDPAYGPATCQKGTIEICDCVICGYKGLNEREVGPSGHSWSEWQVIGNATCKEPATERRECIYCGLEETQTGSYGAHKWGAWVVIQEPDPSGRVGIRERKCSVCGKTERQEFYPDGTLKKGDKGEEVEDLQNKLNEQGHDCGTADGDFGSKTENALKDWQIVNGYTPDGIFWPGQRDEMFGNDDDNDDDNGDDRKYISGIDLELLTDCSQLSGELGQTISVRVKVTNTGETVLTVNSSYTENGNGQHPAYWDGASWDIDDGISGGTSWFNPGETTEGTLNIVVEQNDIDAGEIVRMYTQYARPLYCVVNDKMTDVPAGVENEPEGTNKYWAKEEEKVEDTIEIRIPLTSDGNDDDSESLISAMTLVIDGALPESIASPSVGDTVMIPVLLMNTGETELYAHSFGNSYRNGTDTGERTTWNEGWERTLLPQSGVAQEQFSIITQHDIDEGELYREIWLTAAPMYYAGTDVLTIMPKPDGHDGSTEYRADENVTASVTVCIPLTYGDKDFRYVTVEKSITSTPANGEYYVEGETISYLIKVSIPEGITLEHFSVTDWVNLTNTGTVLEILPYATSANSAEYTYNYVVTAEDVERGYVDNAADAYFFDPEGDAWVSAWSEIVTAPTSAASSGAEKGMLTKRVINTPANGSFFTVGETIIYEIVFENPCEYVVRDIAVKDPLLNGGSDEPINIISVGAAFNSEINAAAGFDAAYVVTVADALAGFVTNTATAEWVDPVTGENLSCTSNTVTTPCGYNYVYVDDGFIFNEMHNGQVAVGGVSISKTVTGTPANGQCYLPGEIVSYKLTVKNTGRLVLQDVAVRDALYGNDPIAIISSMNPGQEETVVFDYVVTEMDAITGFVSNMATAVGYDPEGKAQVAVSNEVQVLVGMPDDFPFGVITEVTVVKEETSTPANGTYYTEGETISYKITYTNTGETQLSETLIYDSLKKDGAEIAYAEMLNPGESRYCTFDYVVTADDVAKGYVANFATAQYTIEGYINGAVSNVVISDTDGDPNTTYVPGSGIIDWGKLRSEASAAAEDTCYVKVVSRDGDSVEYETHFCSKHANMHKAVLTMVQGAGEDATKQQMAWEYAYTLWLKDIDAMYEEILAVCDEEAKITIMSERMNYMVMVANTVMALKAVAPDQPVLAAEAAAQLWQDKCIELCYLMNTAPAERMDSLFNVERAANAVEANANCTCTVTEEKEGKILCTDGYCTVHGFTYEMMEIFLLSDKSVNTWETVRALWEIELNNAYDALYKKAGEGVGNVYLVEYAAITNWINAREAFLNMAYADKPAIVAEAMVNTIMERSMEACEKTK